MPLRASYAMPGTAIACAGPVQVLVLFRFPPPKSPSPRRSSKVNLKSQSHVTGSLCSWRSCPLAQSRRMTASTPPATAPLVNHGRARPKHTLSMHVSGAKAR
eukprot:169683-Rhodomonas_salina.2